MKQKFAKFALLAGLAAIPAGAAGKGALEGQWRNPKGSVTVRVAPCGDAYCGTVVEASSKAKATARKGGTPQLIGTRILTGIRAAGDGEYTGRGVRPKAQHPRARDNPPARSLDADHQGLRGARAYLQGAALDAG